MSILENKRDQLLKHFARFESWEDRYTEIIRKGRALPSMQAEHKIDSFLVRGCQSRTWLYPKYSDGRIEYSADSEAAITKGIVALLVETYSGGTPEEIIALKPDFLKEIGVTQHLSMNRSNGLANMLAMIRIYALGFMGKNKAQ